MGWWDTGDTTDVGTDAIDVGTQGDVPQTGGDTWSMPDWGSLPVGVVKNIDFGGGGGGTQSGGAVTQVGAFGGAAAAVGAGAVAIGARLAPAVFNAIVKLSQRLGGAGTSVVGYGRKVWGQLSSWSAKNPGVSLIATLTSLGLTVEEAAHFVAWGATHKKKRRTRGISGRDVRICRRTIRKLVSMTHLLAQLRGGGHHRSSPYIPRHRHRIVSFRKR